MSRLTAIANTKAVQLAQKGQVNNVLPYCKLNEIVHAKTSNISSKYMVSKEKRSPRLEKLSKPPQGASKLASFDTVLAVGMW